MIFIIRIRCSNDKSRAVFSYPVAPAPRRRRRNLSEDGENIGRRHGSHVRGTSHVHGLLGSTEEIPTKLILKRVRQTWRRRIMQYNNETKTGETVPKQSDIFNFARDGKTFPGHGGVLE